MVMCAVFGCSKRSGRDNVSFFRFPCADTKRNFKLKDLIVRRQKLWITCINRSDMDKVKVKNARICNLHFVSGKPSSLEDVDNPDWAPTLNLGHREQKNMDAAMKRYQRKIQRVQHPAGPSGLFSNIHMVDEVQEYDTNVNGLCIIDKDFLPVVSMNESQLNSISNKSEEPWLKVVSATSLLPDSSDSCLQKGLLREDPDERRKRLENKQLQQSLESDLSQGSNSVESNSTFFVHSQLSKQTISAGSTYSEWKKEEITALIALYQSEKCLYDQTHQFFLDEDEKNKAYQRIQNLLANIRPNCSIIQIKDQIRSLLTQYIAEKLIKDSAIVAGHVTEHSYEPLMWCFGLFQFLDDHIVKTVIPGVKEEIIEMEEDCRSSTSNFICDKRIKDEKEDPYTFEGNSFTNDKSNSLHYAHDKGSTHIVTDSNRKRVSRMLSVKNIPAFDTDERDDIFGEYIASEMRIIKHNASLYLKTKQAIIDVLTSASFEFLNSE